MMRTLFGAVLLCWMVQVSARAEIVLTNGAPSYTEDFNTLASSGTSSTMPMGWYFSETGTRADTAYAAVAYSSSSSPTGPDTYSFSWSTTTGDRALGGIRGSGTNTFETTFGASFTNGSSDSISELAIAYRGEQWFRGTALTRDDRLDFQYSLDATSLSDGTWENVNQLDFGSPVTLGSSGRLNGNFDGNWTPISYTITGLNIAAGESFWIRWTDFNAVLGNGNEVADDGLAIDDFSITAGFEPAGVPEPTSTAVLVILGAGGWVARRIRRRACGDAARG